MRKNSSNSKLRVSVRFVQILVINSSMTAFVFLNISGIQFLKCSSLLGNHGNLLTVWKNETFSLTTKIFRQINSLVTYLVHISTICTAQCEKTRHSLSLKKKIRQINYLVISLVKPLISRNFCEKSVRENFCNFHTVQYCDLLANQ